MAKKLSTTSEHKLKSLKSEDNLKKKSKLNVKSSWWSKSLNFKYLSPENPAEENSSHENIFWKKIEYSLHDPDDASKGTRKDFKTGNSVSSLSDAEKLFKNTKDIVSASNSKQTTDSSVKEAINMFTYISSSVDPFGSTSVDSRLRYSYFKSFTTNDKKINLYIEKRFSLANENRISQFQMRKKNLPNHRLSNTTFGSSQSSSSGSSSLSEFKANKRPSSPYFHKPIKIRNFLDETVYSDILHMDTFCSVGCNSQRCMGAVMSYHNEPDGPPKPEDIITQAMKFLDQFYSSIRMFYSKEHLARKQEVKQLIEKSGTFDMTRYELIYGAKLAWRNAQRCIGRIQWSKLQVFDARSVVQAKEMFDALCQHIRYATNNGNIRSAITIFPQHEEDREDFRIWNSELISYAGYLTDNDVVVGDPKNLQFTEECVKLGWQPKHNQFDVLPIVVSVPGASPEWFDIPEDLILEVQIHHPQYKWFADLGLKWYALPINSGMMLDCGGLQFTACAFNGWYIGTQIGCRCLCDHHRYNIVPTIATKYNLYKSSLLLTDKIVLDVNVAVLHSFMKANVAISDHHGASNAFLYHMDNEHKIRGGCPADWIYIVPPLSSSVLSVYHQEMLKYHLKPSFEHQEKAWVHYPWKSTSRSEMTESSQTRHRTQDTSKKHIMTLHISEVTISTKTKCIILFGSETGKAERLARMLRKIFQLVFDVQLVSMSNYCVEYLAHESLLLIVTSTHGNGDPPYNAQVSKMLRVLFFTHVKSYKTYVKLSSLQGKHGIMEVTSVFDISEFLQNVRYSIFAIGSDNYPHFCSFGKYLNNIFSELGAEKLVPIEMVNDGVSLESTFCNWATKTYLAACADFHMTDIRLKLVESFCNAENYKWNPLVCRLRPAPTEFDRELCKKLSQVHNKKVMPCILTERTQLQAKVSNQQTLLLKLNTQNADELDYSPGDLVGIFPCNSSFLVDSLLQQLENVPQPDQVVQVEFLDIESQSEVKKWIPYEKLPPCSLRWALTYFIDLVAPPAQNVLWMLSKLANIDKEKLAYLARDNDAYEEWRSTKIQNFLDVMNQFPSLRIPAALLLTELPIIHERYYCISSDPAMEVGDLHVTMNVLKFRNYGMVKEGLCTGWLNSCDIGTMVPCTIRRNQGFHLPKNKALPMLLVAAGQGIAPFRSFWQRRVVEQEHYSKAAEDEREILGEITLFFGCRSTALDNIYGKELKVMEKCGVLTYHLAMSQDPAATKMHVHDLLKKKSSELVEAVINKGAHIYASGDITSINEITGALESLLIENSLMTPADAIKFIWQLKDNGVYHEVIFGYDYVSELNPPMTPQNSTCTLTDKSESYIKGKCCGLPCVIA